MSEQSGDVLDEVGRALDALLRRAARVGILGGPDRPDDRGHRPAAPGDVWAAATAEPPPEDPRGHAPADSPGESAARVARHLREAGESLLAAFLEGVSAVDRARARGDRASGGDRYPKRSRQESPGPGAGTSERSGERRDRPERDAWAAATGGSIGSGD